MPRTRGGRIPALSGFPLYPAEAVFWEQGDLPADRMRELQMEVKAEGLWAPHLPREAGGMGTGSITLALMNEILGRSPLAPRAFGTNAPDTGNQELIWLAGTPQQKDRYLHPSVTGDFHPKAEQDLRDDERGPDLLVDHGGLGTPEQMQVQLPLEELVGQFRAPALSAPEAATVMIMDRYEPVNLFCFAVLEDKTAEQGQLAPALDHHWELFARPPWLATGDRGLHAPENERVARDAGVKHLVIPRSGVVSDEQRVTERSRSWRRRYRWRAGIEGRLSSLRRDYGLRRCPGTPRRSRLGAGEDGFIPHLSWGIIASNLHHIGRHLAAKATA